MNVLIAVPWDNIGGVCNVVNAVALHLRNRGHGVHLLLPGESDQIEEVTSRIGLPAFRLNLRPVVSAGAGLRGTAGFFAHLAGTQRRLRGLLRDQRIDVVNAHFPDESSIHLPLACIGTDVQLVTSVHGADLLPYIKAPYHKHHSVNFVLELSDVIVAPSRSYAVAAARNHPVLASRGVTVIPNGIDVDELGATPTAPWTEAEPPYVLSVAALVAYKGLDILIRAFANVAAEVPALRLRLVSNGPERDRLVALAAELGVSDRIDFLGALSRAAVAELIRGATVFVLASRSDSESFGIAAAEALALDRAVIASSVGALPEMIESGHSGLLVPPGDPESLASAMRQLLFDRQLRERLGKTGGTRVRRDFPWSRTGQAYEALFLRVSSACRRDDSMTGMPANTATELT